MDVSRCFRVRLVLRSGRVAKKPLSMALQKVLVGILPCGVEEFCKFIFLQVHFYFLGDTHCVRYATEDHSEFLFVIYFLNWCMQCIFLIIGIRQWYVFELANAYTHHC